MAEYIERGAALAALHRGGEQLRWACDVRTAYAAIKAMPAADVVPVAHGRWMLERTPDGTPYCFHCSVCDSDYHHIGITIATDYCPNCGAKMDGGVDHADELVDMLYDNEFASLCPLDEVSGIVDACPDVDAVPVVRCRDCKYYHLFEKGFRDCRHNGGLDDALPNDFCSYGERRDTTNES